MNRGYKYSKNHLFKGYKHLKIIIIIALTTIFTGAGIYAFFASEVTKSDVSPPDGDIPVTIPENYENLLVLDITIPTFDAGRISEDVKLHNGIASSNPADTLKQFGLTDWYSDHTGNGYYDGNTTIDTGEAIINSEDDILDADDFVRKSGLCSLESFKSVGGFGELYIDSDGSSKYTPGEAIVNIETQQDKLFPGEIIKAGLARMTAFSPNIRFTDGIEGNSTNATYHYGEAIINSTDDILDSDDAILLSGYADLKTVNPQVKYLDFNGDGRYISDEPIILDTGISGQLELGDLDGSGVDKVYRAGNADLKLLYDQDMVFADDDGNYMYSPGELIIKSEDNLVSYWKIVIPGRANLKSFYSISFSDNDNDGSLDILEAIVRNNGQSDHLLESEDQIINSGKADLTPFLSTDYFFDTDGNGNYTDGECIIRNNGLWDVISESDSVLKPGLAFLTSFGANTKWADINDDGYYSTDELMVNSPDYTLNSGEIVKPGFCNLQPISGDVSRQYYSDNNGDEIHSPDELVIFSQDNILSSDDVVLDSGKAGLLSLADNTSTLFVDTDGSMGFDTGEPVINNQGEVPVLDDGDEILISGSMDIKTPDNNIVYIDHNGDGFFQGDSDHDADGNDPDVFDDSDEVLINDTIGLQHLALDHNDLVLRPGLALLTPLLGTNLYYIDDGDAGYDGKAQPDSTCEAVIRDNNSNTILDDTDQVMVTGVGPKELLDEQFIDNNHNGTYDKDEAIWRDLNTNDLVDSDEIIKPGYASLISTDLIKYLDGNSNSQFETEEAMLIDSEPEGVLDTNDHFLKSGSANITRFNQGYARERYVDCNGDKVYSHGEAILYDPYESGVLKNCVAYNPGTLVNFPPEYKYLDADNDNSRICDFVELELGKEFIAEMEADLNAGIIPQAFYDNEFISVPQNPVIYQFQEKEWYIAENIYEGGSPTEDYATIYQVNKYVFSIVVFSWAYSVDDIPGGEIFHEAIIKDSGNPWRFDLGQLNGQDSPDHVILPGVASIYPLPEDIIHPFANAYIDANLSNFPDNREVLIQDNEPLFILDSGDIVHGMIDYSVENKWSTQVAPASHTNMRLFQFHEKFLTAVGDEVYNGQPVINENPDWSVRSGILGVLELVDPDTVLHNVLTPEHPGWDSPDRVVYDGIFEYYPTDLYRGITQNWGPVCYIDDDDDHYYNMGECIITSESGSLESLDHIITPGRAGIRSFPFQIMFTDDERNNGIFDPDEALVLDENDNNMLDIGEIITAGKADTVGEDRNRNNIVDEGEDLDNDNIDNLPYPHFPSLAADNKAYIRSCSTFNHYDQLLSSYKYLDSDRNNQFSADDGLIIDSSPDGYPDGLLGEGSLDGTGEDKVIIPSQLQLLSFSRTEKFVDGNRNGIYDINEALVFDWYESGSFLGEYILLGDSNSGELTYQPPGSRNRDCVLLPGEAGQSAMNQLNSVTEYIYVDNNHSGSYDGLSLSEGYEPIIWTENHQIEAGKLDGTGFDSLIASGYACMENWPVNNKWADSNHDGLYQNNEAIVYDSSDDDIIQSIGTLPDQDQVIVAGEASLREFANVKYVDANENDQPDPGELRVNDFNDNDIIDTGEIIEPGPVPFLKSFDSENHKYCDSNQNSVPDDQEAVIVDTGTEGVLESADQILITGLVTLKQLKPDLVRYSDNNHNQNYDFSITAGIGEAIIIDSNETPDILENGEVESNGYADLINMTGTAYRYSDADRNDQFDIGELVTLDDGDNNVEENEIIIEGFADINTFRADVFFLDTDSDGSYTSNEAIIRTDDMLLGPDDQVLVPGAVELNRFEETIYRFTDADHDGIYTPGEAIIAEIGWSSPDNLLEDTDIIHLEGKADIESFPSQYKFLDDNSASGLYESGEAIIKDSNSNGILESGEIITGGKAALNKFSGSEKYIDGGTSENTHNSRYDQDEAIIYDKNTDGKLDQGNLTSGSGDYVLVSGKANMKHFRPDERYVDANNDNVYNGKQYISEHIYVDLDGNGIVTEGNDMLEYIVVENTGTADNSDLSSVKLWADGDNNEIFNPDFDDEISIMIPHPENSNLWYRGPVPSPPLPEQSEDSPLDYEIHGVTKRFFVTVNSSATPQDGATIKMSLPINGSKTVFGVPGPSDMSLINSYTQKIDSMNPSTVYMSSPDADSVVHGQVVLTAHALDSMGIHKVEFYPDTPETSEPIAVDYNGPPWEVIWDTEGYPFGNYNLYARAYDRTYLRPSETQLKVHYKDSASVPVTLALSSEIPLRDGWNLISIPVETFENSVSSLLSRIDGTCEAVWGYDPITLKWFRYETSGPDFLNDLTNIKSGYGYWLLMNGSGMLKAVGDQAPGFITLYPGWNLIGCNTTYPLDIDQLTSSLSGDFTIYAYNPITKTWGEYDPDRLNNDFETIDPGKGYWIYTNQPGNLIIVGE
ncbi:hypothetical protein GF312_20990 [Candidatus Poribacteria bacterium]|nr:hypothetical protein [Candidatus Poribacteria bacterium]